MPLYVCLKHQYIDENVHYKCFALVRLQNLRKKCDNKMVTPSKFSWKEYFWFGSWIAKLITKNIRTKGFSSFGL